MSTQSSKKYNCAQAQKFYPWKYNSFFRCRQIRKLFYRFWCNVFAVTFVAITWSTVPFLYNLTGYSRFYVHTMPTRLFLHKFFITCLILSPSLIPHVRWSFPLQFLSMEISSRLPDMQFKILSILKICKFYQILLQKPWISWMLYR